MAGPIAPPLPNGDTAKNYMEDDRAQVEPTSAPAQNGGSSNGAAAGADSTSGATSNGAISNGTPSDGTATAERPIAGSSNGRTTPPSDPQPARTQSDGTRAEGNGSRAAGDAARNGNGSTAPAPERVDLPRKSRAGMIERTAVTAVTATMIAGALTSLLFRGSSSRR